MSVIGKRINLAREYLARAETALAQDNPIIAEGSAFCAAVFSRNYDDEIYQSAKKIRSTAAELANKRHIWLNIGRVAV